MTTWKTGPHTTTVPLPNNHADRSLEHRADNCCRSTMTLAQADALIATADYLESLGLQPMFDLDTLRTAWRLFPEHRARIERLARRQGAS